MKDVTLLIAHPDDEALFCWPVLDRVSRIICVSSDLHNPERAWCKERGECLLEVGKLLGCSVDLSHHDSEFYRLPTRNGDLKRVAESLIRQLGDDGIGFTHNAWGEYGNIDHILCHHIARTWQARGEGRTVLVSDIAQEINWLPVTPWDQETYYGGGSAGKFEIDRPLFDRIKAIYDARGCWTWAWEPQETCGVYSL